MDRKDERDWVIKILFQNQFNQTEDLKRVFENHDLDIEKSPFIYSSVESVLDKQEKIDQIIEDNMDDRGASSWSFNNLHAIVKTILRVSVNEFLIQKTVPVSVSINEAVEIAKEYGDDNSDKLVNAVLGRIARKYNA